MIASVARGGIPLGHAAPSSVRGITMNAALGLGHAHLPPGATRSLFSRAQSLLQRNVPRLTQYLGMPRPASPPVSFAEPHHRLLQTVQNRLSMPSRMTLSRPLKAAGMPRPPMLARPMHEVGLGSARKFSSQSTFQHLVQNTSITTRAFWEANWDLNVTEERKIWVKRTQQKKANASSSSKRSRKMSKHTITPVVSTIPSSAASAFDEDEMSVFFASPAEPSVTTFLQIALAPTPTNTMPLDPSGEFAPYLLPLRSLLDTHSQFQARTEDVTAIFACLDSKKVWDQGVMAEGWGDTTGACVELRVKFSGWSEQDVRELLGGLLDVPGCAIQELSIPSEEDSVVHTDSGALFPATNPLEFVMPNVVASLEQDMLTRPSSPFAPSSVSDVTFLDLSDGELSSGMTTPRSAVSLSEWGDSEPLSILHEPRPSPMLMSLSSSFLSRLQEVESFATPL